MMAKNVMMVGETADLMGLEVDSITTMPDHEKDFRNLNTVQEITWALTILADRLYEMRSSECVEMNQSDALHLYARMVKITLDMKDRGYTRHFIDGDDDLSVANILVEEV